MINITNKEILPNVVYWLRHIDMTDIHSEGYVGVTNALVNRINDHYRGKQNGSSKEVSEAIKNYGEENIEAEIVFIGTREECFKEEKLLRPERFIGWNKAKGGSDTGEFYTSNRKPNTPRCKTKKTHKFHWSKGLTNRWSDEQRVKIGSYHKGKVTSEEQKAKHRETYKLNVKHGNNKTVKHIVVYDVITGDRYSFNSISECSDVLYLNHSLLKAIVRRRRKDRIGDTPYAVDYDKSHPLLGVKNGNTKEEPKFSKSTIFIEFEKSKGKFIFYTNGEQFRRLHPELNLPKNAIYHRRRLKNFHFVNGWRLLEHHI